METALKFDLYSCLMSDAQVNTKPESDHLNMKLAGVSLSPHSLNGKASD